MMRDATLPAASVTFVDVLVFDISPIKREGGVKFAEYLATP